MGLRLNDWYWNSDVCILVYELWSNIGTGDRIMSYDHGNHHDRMMMTDYTECVRCGVHFDTSLWSKCPRCGSKGHEEE